MTVLERLVAAGLLDFFDAAVRAHDRARMIAVLAQVEVENPDRSADAILDQPGKYGY